MALGAALGEGDPTRGGSILAVAAYEPPLPWLDEYSRAGSSAGTGPPPRQPDGNAAGGRAGAQPAPTTDGSRSNPDSEEQDPGGAVERFFRRMVGEDAWERLPEGARAERRADGPALEAELRAIRLPRPPFDVSGLQVPAVFARGELSAARHRAGVEWLVRHTPDAELVEVHGAAHGAHLTHPDAFAQFVRRTVARAVLPAGEPG